MLRRNCSTGFVEFDGAKLRRLACARLRGNCSGKFSQVLIGQSFADLLGKAAGTPQQRNAPEARFILPIRGKPQVCPELMPSLPEKRPARDLLAEYLGEDQFSVGFLQAREFQPVMRLVPGFPAEDDDPRERGLPAVFEVDAD